MAKIHPTNINRQPSSFAYFPIRFHCEKSLNLYNKLYSYMSHFPVEWNGITVQTCGLQSKKYRWFYFNFFIILGLVNSTPALYILLHTKSIHYSLIYPTAQTQAVSILCTLCLLNLMANLDSYIYKFKLMKLLNLKLYTRLIGISRISAKNLSSNWTQVAIVINFLLVLCLVLPFIMTIARIRAPGGAKDQMGWAVYEILTKIQNMTCITQLKESNSSLITCEKIFQVLTFLLQFILVYIRSAENIRFIIVFCVIFTYWLELQDTCFKIIQAIYQITQNKLIVFKWYSAWRLAHQYEWFNQIIASLMSLGFVILVMCNIITLRCVGVLGSFKVYIHFPLVSMITGFFVKTVMSCIVKTNVQSEKLILKIIKECFVVKSKVFDGRRNSESKVALKLWKSAQPVSYFCGQYFKLVKGAELIYLYLVMLRTMEGLLFIKID